MYSQVDGLTVTSNFPLRGGKATIYDGGTRVPCVVSWPGKTKPGSKTEAFLTSTDWYPTLLEMMQIPKPAKLTFDGMSQVPALLGKPGPRESITCFVPSYYSRPGTIPSTYIRRGDWKLIRFHGDGPQRADRFELYNLAMDIGETKDLAAAKPVLVEELNTEMSAYLARTEALLPLPNPAYNPDAKTAPKQAIDPAVLFKARDKNQDGFLTLKEYIGNPKNRNVPVLTKRFNSWDKNKDSRVTLKEMKGTQ